MTVAQLFLLALELRPLRAPRDVRWPLVLVGHALVLLGTARVLGVIVTEPGVAVIAYIVGFSILVVHEFWMRQLSDTVLPPQPGTDARYWEGVLLVVVIVAIAGSIAASFTAREGILVPADTLGRSAAVVVGVSSVIVLATLAAPGPPPAAVEFLSTTTATILQHAIVIVLALNALVLAVLLIEPGLFLWVLGGYLTVLCLGVGLEYLEVGHAHRRTRESPPPMPDDAPVTVMVAAAFEGEVLPETLRHNLETLADLPFVVVPATKSTDDTVDVARQFEADYPDRVRVVEGTTGSKAGDLNRAWEVVETPYVLILDADEFVDTEFVARGLARLRERPDVGVVQGRKAAANPDDSRLSRFVSIERQHSTWVDHPFVDDVFDAGHFAGSAAIFRREVPPSVDGWTEGVLTEDIELTIRLYLRTDWEVVYDSQMVVWESTPETVWDLVRQRVRWSRGWAQVTRLHGAAIWRSWRDLGWRRTLGLAWVLFIPVSSPFVTIFPILFLLWFVGFAPPLPLVLAIALALFLLPARSIAYGYAAFRDPIVSRTATPTRIVEAVVYANLWILFGWIVQLHSLYLQAAGAPAVWNVTSKVVTKTESTSASGTDYEDRGGDERERDPT
ncbi:glycosyltransferase [Natronolimnohabitans innermongolicus]|uniref:glycosyltransferase n=1 Tax=Natronolimnohabitans innermongolicus TaxID=253107 RepID=UPI000A0165E5|nr:glycosyltransferase family 2 protein [Natronolimnohabitans innermongolicus]